MLRWICGPPDWPTFYKPTWIPLLVLLFIPQQSNSLVQWRCKKYQRSDILPITVHMFRLSTPTPAFSPPKLEAIIKNFLSTMKTKDSSDPAPASAQHIDTENGYPDFDRIWGTFITYARYAHFSIKNFVQIAKAAPYSVTLVTVAFFTLYYFTCRKYCEAASCERHISRILACGTICAMFSMVWRVYVDVRVFATQYIRERQWLCE